MRKLIPTFLFFLVIGVTFSAAFQNCSPQHLESFSSNSLPLNHPDVTGASNEIIELPALGDRDYLKSVYLQIFSSGTNNEEIPHLEYRFDVETNPHQHLLGRSCNPMETGDNVICHHSPSNTEIPMITQSSSARSAVRIQVCRRMVENDHVLQWTLAKLSQKDAPPNDTAISEAASWFYPHLEASQKQELQQSLKVLNTEMSKKSESVTNRWRMLILALCESPGWEVL